MSAVWDLRGIYCKRLISGFADAVSGSEVGERRNSFQEQASDASELKAGIQTPSKPDLVYAAAGLG